MPAVMEDSRAPETRMAFTPPPRTLTTADMVEDLEEDLNPLSVPPTSNRVASGESDSDSSGVVAMLSHIAQQEERLRRLETKIRGTLILLLFFFLEI
jgi:hypothetical protein